jgi:hypothetical protein
MIVFIRPPTWHFTRNLMRIDREKAHAPLDDLLLRLLRQSFPDALRPACGG